MLLQRILTLFLTCILITTAHAADELAQLNQLLANTKTLQANLSQVADGCRLSGPRIYTGQFYKPRLKHAMPLKLIF